MATQAKANLISSHLKNRERNKPPELIRYSKTGVLNQNARPIEKLLESLLFVLSKLNSLINGLNV